jgi:hypothetical protein
MKWWGWGLIIVNDIYFAPLHEPHVPGVVRTEIMLKEKKLFTGVGGNSKFLALGETTIGSLLTLKIGYPGVSF